MNGTSSTPKTAATAIIVAGGRGLRMKSDTRKQYLSLAGKPVIARTLAAFDACPAIDRVILVAPSGDRELLKAEMLPAAALQKPVRIVGGGSERQDSVYNGLLAAEGAEIVAIHDGVRPFVAPEAIAESIAVAAAEGACILAIPSIDTLKETNSSDEIIATVDRSRIRLAQTPQTFRYDLIRKAHDDARKADFRGTDDASLLERLGIPVRTIPGSRFNLKITTPEDLLLAEAILPVIRA